ncbi:MAG: lamin tail domain-containing protein, partial [archaeon]
TMNGKLILGGNGAADEEVALTVKDKDGNIVFISQTMTDSSGEFSGKYRISASMQAGRYTSYAAYDGLISESDFSVYPNVIINEVMFYPQNDDLKKEFIELYNPYDEDANLSGWTIRDNDGSAALVSSNMILPAGSFALITADGSVVAVPQGVKQFKTGANILGRLQNSGQTITLFDGNNNAVDSFTYKNTYGADRDHTSVIDSNGEGASLERIDPYVLTNYYANWNSSIGAATPGKHNTVYIGYSHSNTTLLFADAPRYVMAQNEIDINTRVRNNEDKYELVGHEYALNGTTTGLKYALVEPMDDADHTYQLITNPGEYKLRVAAMSAGESPEGDIESIITVFGPVMNGTNIIELYKAEMLVPAIVPRGNAFQVITVLSNEYDDDVENINVNLALPQAGGFTMTDAPDKTLAALHPNTLDSSIVYTIQAAPDMPVEITGKRTISLYSKGTVSSHDTWDATSRTIEIINHSSPVISLDLNIPEEMAPGRTYNLVGAAFNTGTEYSKDIILKIRANGLSVMPEQAIIIDELAPSSFEMYSFYISAENEGDYDVVLEMKDNEGNSYILTNTVHVKKVQESADFGAHEDYGAVSGQDIANKATTIKTAEIQEERDEQDSQKTVASLDENKDTNDFEVNENTAEAETTQNTESNKPDAMTTTPTGKIIGVHLIPWLAAAILAAILVVALVLNSRKIKAY